MNSTVIAHVTDTETGAILGRIVASQEYDYNLKPSEYMDSGVSVAVVGAGYCVDETYYERNLDGPIYDALDRFSDEHEHYADVFARYMRIYRPMIPFTIETIETGYSQGDYVDIVAWCDRGDTWDDQPPYVQAAERLNMIKDHLNVLGAVARGQFWKVSLERVEYGEYDVCSGRQKVDFADAAFGDSLGGILCMEEFSPWKELLPFATELTHDLANDVTIDDNIAPYEL